jgi:putrescine transport system substrate-binding protein
VKFPVCVNACIGVMFVLCSTVFAATPSNQLNIMNWSDYIAPDTVAKFEKETGIKIKYDIADSDDTLQAKLLSGNSGYDVVYPSSTYMAKQTPAGVYEHLDWSKIPNRVNLDQDLLKRIADQDNNRFWVPYVWGTLGLIVNKNKVSGLLGKDVPLDSWSLVFNAAQVSKLSGCGVSVVDSAADVFPIMLAYMGRNPNSKKASDYEDAAKELKKIRPYVTQFSSSFLNDVAGGDVCLAMGWSGDARMIARRVKEAHQNFEIVYEMPKGQTGLWFTMMGIPADAPNKENAYKWINFLLRPEIAADITNAITYPTAVPLAKKMIKPELLADKSLYPSDEMMKQFFVFEPIDTDTSRLMNRLWVQFKSGR